MSEVCVVERLRKVEAAKWLGIAILLAMLTLVSSKLSNSLFLGVLWIAGLLVLGVCAYHTVYGKVFSEFARASHTELRKVKWPDRKTTLTGSLMVIIVVMIVAAFLMLVDGGAGIIVGWITGQKV